MKPQISITNDNRIMTKGSPQWNSMELKKALQTLIKYAGILEEGPLPDIMGNINTIENVLKKLDTI